MTETARLAFFALLIASWPFGICYADKAAETLPRLAGIIVWPQARVAILTDGPGETTSVLREGDIIGSYRLKTIARNEVIISGPGDDKVLRVEGADSESLSKPSVSRGQLQARPAMLAGMNEAGATIGRLATERDGCSRRGLLPAVTPSAEKQLSTMLKALSNPPAGMEVDGSRGAPSKARATAMQTGWDAAIEQDRESSYDAAQCARIGTQWASQGARYGFR